MSWQTIRYRDFYDLPRIFITNHNGKQYLFDCPFDDELDDYSDNYRVYELPANLEDELQGSWERLAERAVGLVGEVPINEVHFDDSKRKRVDTAVLEGLLGRRDPRTTRVA